jgi:hypothetical protein
MLAAATRLAPHEILAPLVAGGMGEVYRARDLRLGREVALKVLPETMARDPDRLARFAREAKALAALSHPNILSVSRRRASGHRRPPLREPQPRPGPGLLQRRPDRGDHHRALEGPGPAGDLAQLGDDTEGSAQDDPGGEAQPRGGAEDRRAARHRRAGPRVLPAGAAGSPSLQQAGARETR